MRTISDSLLLLYYIIFEDADRTAYDVVLVYVKSGFGRLLGAAAIEAFLSARRSAVLASPKKLTEEGIIR